MNSLDNSLKLQGLLNPRFYPVRLDYFESN